MQEGKTRRQLSLPSKRYQGADDPDVVTHEERAETIETGGSAIEKLPAAEDPLGAREGAVVGGAAPRGSRPLWSGRNLPIWTGTKSFIC